MEANVHVANEKVQGKQAESDHQDSCSMNEASNNHHHQKEVVTVKENNTNRMRCGTVLHILSARACTYK